MTPHISGTSPLSAQARYAAGTREILECWFEKRPIRNEYLIVDGGKLAGRLGRVGVLLDDMERAPEQGRMVAQCDRRPAANGEDEMLALPSRPMPLPGALLRPRDHLFRLEIPSLEDERAGVGRAPG